MTGSQACRSLKDKQHFDHRLPSLIEDIYPSLPEDFELLKPSSLTSISEYQRSSAISSPHDFNMADLHPSQTVETDIMERVLSISLPAVDDRGSTQNLSNLSDKATSDHFEGHIP